MNILFIACYAPFINNSAAIRTLQYLNKISNTSGYKVHLLTVNFPKDSIYYDENLAGMIAPEVKVHLIDGGIIFNKFMPRKSTSNVSKNIKKSRKNKFLRRIKNYLATPDMYIRWANKAAKFGISLMEKEKFDVIFSMHEPPSSHICAYYIKKKFKNVKWISYWSDPWLKDSTRENSFWLKRLIEKKLEKKVVRLSDKFLFVTEPNRIDYINTYNIPDEKTNIVSRGFDLEFYTKIEEKDPPKLIQKDKINFLYAGEIFSKLRDLKPFINALNKLKSNDIDLYKKLNILFFGNIDDEAIKNDLDNIDVVTVNGRISYDKVVEYMVNSEVLLLFGNKNSKQIPAKIYDYFGTKAKIVVIYGDESDPIKELVENNDKCICINNSEIDIHNTLKSIAQENKEEIIADRDLNYEWKNIVEKLIEIIEEN